MAFKKSGGIDILVLGGGQDVGRSCIIGKIDDKTITNICDNKLFFSNKNGNTFLFDLRKYVNQKINKFDINKVENIDLDTYADKDNFFSYRRSVHSNEKDYGRCISSISLSDD